MNLFGGGRDSEVIAVFDIGSGSVGGALVRLPAGRQGLPARAGLNGAGKPEIFSVAREPIVFQQNFNFQEFLSSMLQVLGRVTEALTRASAVPQRVFCFLASPWYASQTRVVKFSKNASFVFTRKLADNLIAKEIENFERVYLKKHLGPKGHARLIESKTLAVKLNGYSVPKPLGQRTAQIEMTMFLSMSPESILLAIEEAVKRFFGRPIRFFSFPLAAYEVCRRLFKDKNDFILMDAGSEITDVSLIKDNAIGESLSFPLGKNFLIRNLISGLGQTPAEAASTLSLFLSGNLKDSRSGPAGQILKNARDEWLKYFRNALAHMTYDLSLPSEIMLTADEDAAPWFVETIKQEDYNQNVLTDKSFNVIMLDGRVFGAILNLDKLEDRDPFLMLEAIFAKSICSAKT